LTRGFRIGQHEVTRADWEGEGLELPERDVPGTGAADDLCLEPNCPITNVNIFDAIAFVNLYSEQRGLPPCYELRDCTGEVGSGPECEVDSDTGQLIGCDRSDPGFDCLGLFSIDSSIYECRGFRLPTEAEWEYAARAGTRTSWWTGDIQSEPELGGCFEQSSLVEIASYCFNSGLRPHPVGEKQASPWGLYDMFGNVYERTTDLKYGFGYGEGPVVDPLGYYLTGREDRNLMPEIPSSGLPNNRSGMIMRGGAYFSPSIDVTSGGRATLGQENGNRATGFRLAQTVFDE
jgi:formylglycine-generating enzyme required for sulfatase activity